jgi:hypothetical protein
LILVRRIRFFRTFAGGLILAALAVSGRAANVSLDHLRAHPRLLLTAEDQTRLEGVAKQNPLFAAMLGKLREAAEFAITVPAATYKLEGPGPRRQLLLHQSQAALSRVMICGLAYRFFDDLRFADRVRVELDAVTAFKDWHPSHFLDTAEMTAVVAIGYDWLYSVLSEEERRRYRTAIIDKGLQPAERFYGPPRHWPTFANNWNQVCNAGMTLGALAIADQEPELARRFVSYAVASAPRGMTSYAPDGAYPEGPMYWTYGTVFNCLMIAALDSALGTDFGLSQAPGFDRTGLYIGQMISPRRDFFNYADCHNDDGFGQSAGAMYFLARKFDRPLFAWFRSRELQQMIGSLEVTQLKRANKYFALDIVWFDARGSGPPPEPLPLTSYFRGTEAVTLRTAFDEPRAGYVGFKGGNNAANHSHLDLGSFVFESQGVRWALDLGADDYDAEGYWDVKEGKRWRFYRLNTQSHNTLVIDGQNQDPRAVAPVVRYSPTSAHAVADLSAAYPGLATRVWRGVDLREDAGLLVQDEIDGVPPGKVVRWGMVTAADVELDGSRAVLRQDGQEMRVEIVEPRELVFEVVSTAPPTPEEKRNTGTRMLAIHRISSGAPQTLRVSFSPAGAKAAMPPLRPLAAWESVAISR